jgi:hypothetical protein
LVSNLLVAVQQGACQTGAHPTSVWFSSTRAQRTRARELCEVCPLLDSCREFALHELVLEPKVHVVVAGLREQDIIDLRKERGITPPRALPPPSQAKPYLLGIADKDAVIRKTTLARSHNKGGHRLEPRDDCPRCTAQ